MINCCQCGKILFDKTYEELAKEKGYAKIKRVNLSYFTGDVRMGRLIVKCKDCKTTNLFAMEHA